MFKEIRVFIKRHEKPLSLGALFIGFFIDAVTLDRIDLWFENIVIIFYLTLLLLAIALIANQRFTFRTTSSKFKHLYTLAPLAQQFAMGGLTSAMLLFYFRSSDFLTSWTVILIFLFLFLSTEMLRNYVARFTFALIIFSVLLLAYLQLIAPLLVGQIGLEAVMIGLLISFVLNGVIYFFLSKKLSLPHQVKRWLIGGVVVSHVLFSVLYLSKVLPPVPLVAIDAILSQNVTREGDEYIVTNPDYVRPWQSTYTVRGGEPVYFFTSVYIPVRIAETSLQYGWQRKQNGSWVTTDIVAFVGTGGRDQGFRGYTYKESFTDGEWRVRLITKDGRVISSRNFHVLSE